MAMKNESLPLVLLGKELLPRVQNPRCRNSRSPGKNLRVPPDQKEWDNTEDAVTNAMIWQGVDT